MKVYIGTSGWMYGWNPNGFDWYVSQSGLDSVELNSSFYRFPFPNQVRSWARKSSRFESFRWCVKVHRSVSHYRRLNEEAVKIYLRFRDLFKPLDDLIDYYLIQLPPNFIVNERNLDRVSSFVGSVGSDGKLAIEFRHGSWFREDMVRLAEELGFILVSVDSPLGSFIAASRGVVYLRMHGRTDWYIHYYTDDELREIIERIVKEDPGEVYIYFNNDHDMLENARRFKEVIFGRYIKDV
jgi:uncharacterized protein YecE (DUF72 family)